MTRNSKRETRPPRTRRGSHRSGPSFDDPVPRAVYQRLQKSWGALGWLNQSVGWLGWQLSQVWWRRCDGNDIQVAVFDTWPMDANAARVQLGQPVANGLAEVRKARSRIAAKRSGNWRLDEAASGQIVPENQIFEWTPPPRPDQPRCRSLDCDGRTEEIWDVSDHGLFVADVLNDMAPGATMSVYRVADEYGTGDLLHLAQAVEQAIGAAGGRKLVLNFSLGMIAPLAMFWKVLADPGRYAADAANWSADLGASAADPAAALKELLAVGLVEQGTNRFARELGALQYLFDFAELPNVLAVASAGNDSCPGPPKRIAGPRIPAAVNGVLAVSDFVSPNRNANTRWERVWFSNDDDFFPTNDGIGAYGGGTTTDGTTSHYWMPVGLFASKEYPVAPPVPPQLPANDTGFAKWEGTSFAAPVVAGFAACIWGEKPELRASQVKDLIVPQGSAGDEYLPFRQQ